jgi:hypothetical protein
MNVGGPSPGVEGGGHGPSPEQIAIYKEAGVRNEFITNLGNSIGPYVMGSVTLAMSSLSNQADD